VLTQDHTTIRTRSAGLLVALLAIAGATALVFPLKQSAPPVALGVVYLTGVLLVASFWGLWIGVATAIMSALAFNFFHIAPTGHFTVASTEHVVAIAVFFVAAIVASDLAGRVRCRADEAEQRRREADLSAELARRLLRSDDLRSALAEASQRLADTLGVTFASVELGEGSEDEGRVAFPLMEGRRRLGTLFVPADTDETQLERLRKRVAPALEALLAAAIERDELLGDRVEAAALRRSDVVKTALLRTVSHDLRSPLTAILAAAEPLGASGLTDTERRELSAVVREEGERLSRLIDNLLDLSRLEANAATPRLDWCDVGEVISSAADHAAGDLRLQISPELPVIHADAAQLERAFANLLENSIRHSGGHPVLVRAWALHNRIVVRIVDRGPGIPQGQRAQIFEPFFSGGNNSETHRGSGLGLAIVRGFVEANGGRVSVDSLPGGTSFVVEFPIGVGKQPFAGEDRPPAPIGA
jgi:two-component system sensor histidine kinase KdpD